MKITIKALVFFCWFFFLSCLAILHLVLFFKRKKKRRKKKIKIFGTSPIYIAKSPMQTVSNLGKITVSICREQMPIKMKILSRMCLFEKAVSMYSSPEVYLLLKIQTHNLMFYTNFISRLTFWRGKSKIKFFGT